MRIPVCPRCSSVDIEQFDNNLDALTWFIQHNRVPTSSPYPPAENEWACNPCGMVFACPV
jgi:hypothetical protein